MKLTKKFNLALWCKRCWLFFSLPPPLFSPQKAIKAHSFSIKKGMISLSKTSTDFAPAENWLIIFSYRDQKFKNVMDGH